MRPGERAAFRFASAAEADDQQQQQQQQQSSELTYEIEMLGVTAVEVLSPSRRPSDRLLKTVLEGGAGAETPKDGARVIVDVAVEGRPSAPPSGDNATTSAGGDMADDAGAVQRRELTLGDGVGGEVALRSCRWPVRTRARSDASVARPASARHRSRWSRRWCRRSIQLAELLVATIRLSLEQQRALEHRGRQELFGHIERLKATANRRFAAGDGGGVRCVRQGDPAAAFGGGRRTRWIGVGRAKRAVAGRYARAGAGAAPQQRRVRAQGEGLSAPSPRPTPRSLSP